MGPARSALFLDFDNVFGGLLKHDPAKAIRFAEDPGTWLQRLTSDDGTSRRWLMLRCYLNSAGSVDNPEHPGTRLHFAKFRQHFTDAGFEVVDCPSLAHLKNAADIRLVVNALDTLRSDTHYDEFVIASGDSDMTPLLFHLRASGRRVTLLSSFETASVMGAVADRLIGPDDLLLLLRTETECAETRFRDFVTHRYAETPEPLNLGTFANEVRHELGDIASESRWFGHTRFLAAVQSLDLPGLCTSQHYIWDESRHPAPVLRRAADPP